MSVSHVSQQEVELAFSKLNNLWGIKTLACVV